MTEKIKEAIKEVLSEEIYVSDISDSNYVDYIIGSSCFSSFEYKYELIDELTNKIIKRIEG